MGLSRQQLRAVVLAGAEVLARPGVAVDETTRFAEDLHADSLDMVEFVEVVETELAQHGVAMSLPGEGVLSLVTVGDAVDLIAATAAVPSGQAVAGSAGGVSGRAGT